jgi:hypothetical protein
VEEQHQARLKEAAEPKPAAPAPTPAKGHKGHKHGKEVPQEQEDSQQVGDCTEDGISWLSCAGTVLCAPY